MQAIRLNFNESPYGMCAEAERAARLAIHDSGRYQFALVEQLRQEIAHEHGVPVEWLALYPGSNRALHYATLAFSNADLPLVMANPGYAVCEQAASLKGSRVVKVRLSASGAHDTEAMRLVAAQGGLIYIANPNNPTGTVTGIEELLALTRYKNPASYVLIDEAYIEYSEQTSMLKFVMDVPRLIVTRTFSKIYGMAGLRVGYAIAHPEVLALMRTVPAEDISVPAAAAALASLRQYQFVETCKLRNQQIRIDFMRWLQARQIEYSPSQVNCLLIRLGGKSEQLSQQLCKQFQILPGKLWPEFPEWVRITLGTQEEMHKLKQALSVLLEKQEISHCEVLG